MSAGQLDITIEQGASFSMPLAFTNADTTPLDVSAWVFTGQVRQTYSSPTALQDFTFTAGLATNQVTVSITDVDTALIPVLPTTNFQITPTLYCYDMIATLPDMSVLRILQGTVLVSPDVTR